MKLGPRSHLGPQAKKCMTMTQSKDSQASPGSVSVFDRKIALN